MKILRNRLKTALNNGATSINIQTPISGTLFVDLSIISLCGSPFNLNMSDKDFKIRFQTLISGTQGFEEGNYRIDSHSLKPIHSHFIYEEDGLDYENSLTPITLGSVLKMILGSEYKEIEERIDKT